MANPVGRPKKDLSELPKDWKERIIELGEEGGSDVEMRALLRISRDLWYRWLEEEPEFSETIKEAHELCEAFWTAHGRRMATGAAEGMPAVYIFNMKNRFKWRDKPEEEQVKVEIPAIVINTNESN